VVIPILVGLKPQNFAFLRLILGESIKYQIVPKTRVSFIRVKKINGNEYAYLVSNRWYKRKHKGKNKGPRQRVGKYLGKVYRFDKANDTDFLTFLNITDIAGYLEKNNNNKSRIFKDLIEWELHRHNIDKEEFVIDYSNKRLIKKNSNKEVSLRINEGYLNSFTMDRIFRLQGGESYFLAKCFIEAGIGIPKEVFVGMFG
jgi:hypothetical protein